MTAEREMVTVPREVLEAIRAKFSADAIYSPYYPGARMSRTEKKRALARYVVEKIDMALALTSSDPEGGARGERAVQGSIATKRASNDSSASVLSGPTDELVNLAHAEYHKVLGDKNRSNPMRAALEVVFDNLRATKSAPGFKASHNSGERDPSVMTDCPGADTKSDGIRRATIEACARFLEREYPLNVSTNAFAAAIRSLLAVAETGANAPGNSSLVSGVSSAPNHQPHAVSQGWPANLHPRTLDLVQRFALVLAKKLRLAEEKYGFSDGWANDDWEQECRAHLYSHLEKGDPRDVAAYCAFMWHHGWITTIPAVHLPAPPSPAKTGGARD